MKLKVGTICRITPTKSVDNQIRPISWDSEADQIRLRQLFPTWEKLKETLVEILEWIPDDTLRSRGRDLYLVRTIQLKEDIKFSSFVVYLKPISGLETLAEMANDNS